MYATYLLSQDKSIRDEIINNPKEKEKFENLVKEKLLKLLMELDKEAPCTAVYNGKGTTSSSGKPLCGKLRGTHGETHTTEERVNFLIEYTETTGK